MYVCIYGNYKTNRVITKGKIRGLVTFKKEVATGLLVMPQ